MNDTRRRMLTEYLGECWHEITDKGPYQSTCSKCGITFGAIHSSDWNPTGFNRTFTTRNDMMDLYEAIAKKGKWWEFVDYAGNQDTEHSVTEFETILQIFASIASWLFCLNGEGYEERCQMVADWIKEASHEST